MADTQPQAVSPPEADVIEALITAATVALQEMCNTVAPRNSFTDAVDALDAALSRLEASQPASEGSDLAAAPGGERPTLGDFEAHLSALRRAIEEDDPKRELLVRVKDLAEVLRIASGAGPSPAAAPGGVDAQMASVAWAVGRWNAEVANRPLRNIHRRSLDDTWRQVIRHFGGNDEVLCGPRHDDLVVANPSLAVRSAPATAPDAGLVEAMRYALQLALAIDYSGSEPAKRDVRENVFPVLRAALSRAGERT